MIKSKGPFVAILVLALLSLFIYFNFENFAYLVHPYNRNPTVENLLWKKETHFKSIAEDLQLLKYALEKAYVGFDFFDPNLKKTTLKRLDALIESSKQKSFQEVCVEIAEVLSFLPDNHLQVRQEQMNCTSKVSQFRKPSVGVNYNQSKLTEEKLPWAIGFLSVKNAKIPVLSLFYFPDPSDLKWNGFDHHLEQLLNAPALVIDLRGNSGGNDQKAFQIARRLIGNRFKRPQLEKFTRITPEAYVLELNIILLTMDAFRRSGKEIPRYLLNAENETRLNLQQAKSQHINRNEHFMFPEESSVSHAIYAKPIFILIDAQCASSGELLVLALKESPNVTTVGENTAGFLKFGNAGALILPFTQIRVNISLTYKKFRQTNIQEKIGISPDVSTPGKDAIELVQRKIEELL